VITTIVTTGLTIREDPKKGGSHIHHLLKRVSQGILRHGSMIFNSKSRLHKTCSIIKRNMIITSAATHISIFMRKCLRMKFVLMLTERQLKETPKILKIR
jgi:hypothetical protein